MTYYLMLLTYFTVKTPQLSIKIVLKKHKTKISIAKKLIQFDLFRQFQKNF